MITQSSFTPIYEASANGILVPTGHASSFVQQSASSYLVGKERAIQLVELFAQNQLRLHPASDIALMIANARQLSDSWLCNETSELTQDRLHSALHLNRIADAMLPLGVSDQAKKMLEALQDGNLSLMRRDRSKAKDTLWELELWQLLRRRGIDAKLEEPDIVIELNGCQIGIACKKIYSDKNASKQLSNAVFQIAANSDFGFVAINLDDSIPEDHILVATDLNVMGELLANVNIAFIQQNEGALRRYLESGRALAAIVSTGAIADIPTSSPRRLNARQSYIWTVPGMAPEAERHVRDFENAFLGDETRKKYE